MYVYGKMCERRIKSGSQLKDMWADLVSTVLRLDERPQQKNY
jgi:hypothetical protein